MALPDLRNQHSKRTSTDRDTRFTGNSAYIDSAGSTSYTPEESTTDTQQVIRSRPTSSGSSTIYTMPSPSTPQSTSAATFCRGRAISPMPKDLPPPPPAVNAGVSIAHPPPLPGPNPLTPAETPKSAAALPVQPGPAPAGNGAQSQDPMDVPQNAVRSKTGRPTPQPDQPVHVALKVAERRKREPSQLAGGEIPPQVPRGEMGIGSNPQQVKPKYRLDETASYAPPEQASNKNSLWKSILNYLSGRRQSAPSARSERHNNKLRQNEIIRSHNVDGAQHTVQLNREHRVLNEQLPVSVTCCYMGSRRLPPRGQGETSIVVQEVVDYLISLSRTSQYRFPQVTLTVTESHVEATNGKFQMVLNPVLYPHKQGNVEQLSGSSRSYPLECLTHTMLTQFYKRVVVFVTTATTAARYNESDCHVYVVESESDAQCVLHAVNKAFEKLVERLNVQRPSISPPAGARQPAQPTKPSPSRDPTDTECSFASATSYGARGRDVHFQKSEYWPGESLYGLIPKRASFLASPSNSQRPHPVQRMNSVPVPPNKPPDLSPTPLYYSRPPPLLRLQANAKPLAPTEVSHANAGTHLTPAEASYAKVEADGARAENPPAETAETADSQANSEALKANALVDEQKCGSAEDLRRALSRMTSLDQNSSGRGTNESSPSSTTAL